MERKALDRFSGACFLCPARTFLEGKYYCDPSRLNNSDINLKVSRHRPNGCPDAETITNQSTSAYMMLKKQLQRLR